MKNLKTYDSALNELEEKEKLAWGLLLAAEELNIDEMKRLIDLGADPNSRDSYRQTPLHVAISNLQLRSNSKKKSRKIPVKDAANVIELLISSGSDPNSKTVNGTTPALIAAGDLVYGEAILKLLMDVGADLNVPTNTGNTPMKRALGYYNKPFIIGLMRGGVNIMDEFKNIDELSEYFFGDLSWIPEDLMEKVKRMQKGKSAFGM